jgi:hypothetical protein
MDVIRLPGGFEIRVPEGKTLNEAFAPHAMMAIAEGLCPLHATRMEPVTLEPWPAAGHCRDCHCYWYADGEQYAREIDFVPHSAFTPAPPGHTWARVNGPRPAV